MTDPLSTAENRVLDDYLSEPTQDRATLERYLHLYPDHAEALHNLHFRIVQQADTAPADNAVDEVWLDSVVARMRRRLDTKPNDPFQNLTPAQLTAIRETIGMRAFTLSGFKDRCVEAATVPKHVLQQLADAVGQSLADFLAYLSLPPKMSANLSFRADRKPQSATEKISFAKLLEDANEPDDVRARLLEDNP